MIGRLAWVPWEWHGTPVSTMGATMGAPDILGNNFRENWVLGRPNSGGEGLHDLATWPYRELVGALSWPVLGPQPDIAIGD